MTFTFPRLSAGIYEIQKDSNTVGFIRKVNATKWILVDVVDTPQHVSATLKSAKYAAENLIIFNTVDNTQECEYNDSVEDEKVNEDLNKVVEGSLNCYKQVEGNELIKVSPSAFNFEATLEPIVF